MKIILHTLRISMSDIAQKFTATKIHTAPTALVYHVGSGTSGSKI